MQGEKYYFCVKGNMWAEMFAAMVGGILDDLCGVVVMEGSMPVMSSMPGVCEVRMPTQSENIPCKVKIPMQGKNVHAR